MKRFEELENKSIYLIREAYSKFNKVGMLWSMGKDSTVLLWLCLKAFGEIPFPVIHIDTGKKFQCMYSFRDELASQLNLKLIVAKNPAADTQQPSCTDKLHCCNLLKTQTLKHVIAEHKFDAVMLAIRRDEHGIRAKERYFSPRDQQFRWDYQNQPAELWDYFEPQKDQGTHYRIHPLLDWTELDIWEYIRWQHVPVVPLYFSKDGKRFRSIGCEPCCLPIDSNARTHDQIISEFKCTNAAEREGRAQDKEAETTMQQLRSLGYM